ncbi:hypothetical protein FA13DRAFT_230753 [Coprinellus micaceus]|uniref:Uncharacterized protein n=1 Tax=Coprinellus micaceus TaxID=71717 RepID=A0A4Y7TFD9_COPMI|nr:hypothetical protein FA13DRAFT_230753 [Coprinellus micaceus]
MTSKLSHLTAAHHRLVSWRGQTLMPHLPSELIFQEILPYLYDDTPTSLVGLQVALTCKAFYQELYPCVAQFFINRIVEAYAQHWTLCASLVGPGQPTGSRMEVQHFTRMVKAAFKQSSLEHPDDSTSGEIYSGFKSPFRLTYYVHLGSFDDIDLLWALISLLSKPHVSKFVRRLEIALADNGAVRVYTEDRQLVNASERWKRAFVKLMNIATETDRTTPDLAAELCSGPRGNPWESALADLGSIP